MSGTTATGSSPFKKTATYLLSALLFAAAGWAAHGWYDSQFKVLKPRRAQLKGFRFTSPLLDIELPEGMGVNSEPMPFKQNVKDFVDKQISIGQAQHVSVYYRDLHDGPWFGINEDREFDPASLMKVPFMIAWLKRAEKNPQVLNERLSYEYTDDMRTMQDTKPGRSVEPGRSYTVEELLRLMMNYSDNNATRMLYSKLKPEELQDILDGMDVVNKVRDGANSVTAHGYSGLFRILYNAAYLNREMSERALQLLSLQDHPQGMAAGVPKGTVVAAKFGERTSGAGGKDHQLHEFGIVYHPKHTYILGVMTSGSDPEALAGVIRQVSQIVYTYVDAGTFSQEDSRR